MNPSKYSNPKINSNPNYSGPDWTPDFEEKFDIEYDSIGLALCVLGISKAEYNSMNIQELKQKKRIDCETSHIYALNILIYYKKNQKFILPQLSPVKHKSNFNLSDKNNYSSSSINSKIFPELDDF